MVESLEIDRIDKKSHHHNPYCISVTNVVQNITKEKETTKKNCSKMKIKHIKNLINAHPTFNYTFEEAMFEGYNESKGILNRINSYINFITSCQNNNTPSIMSKKQRKKSLGNVGYLYKKKLLQKNFSENIVNILIFKTKLHRRIQQAEKRILQQNHRPV